MASYVTVHYERRLPVALDDAYEWLTDYRDDDPSRTDAVVVKRPVLERTEDLVRLEGTVDVMGRRATGVTEIDLMPPDRWRARIVEGAGRGSVYEYALEPIDAGSCRLTVAYRFRVRRLRSKLKLWLARPAIGRELGQMWDGFAESMVAELGARS